MVGDATRVALAILLATWIGYPLVIRLLGALRGGVAGGSTTGDRTVTVIIASNNDAAAVRARVDDVLRSTYPSSCLSVIVGLDAVAARATASELSWPGGRVTVVPGDPEGGKASNLNAAVRHATSEILVFTDTAQRFDPDAIRALADAFDDASMGVVSGMLEISAGKNSLNLAERYWRYERWLRHWESRVDSTIGVTGAIYAMRRELWTPLPAGLILDDVYVPMHLALEGWRVGFDRGAVAYDDRRFSPSDEYRRKVRTLTGVIQLCAWLPGILNPLRNRLFLQFFFHKLLRLLTPYLTLVAALGLAWEGSGWIVRAFGVTGFIGVVVAGVALCLVPPVRRRVRSQLAWAYALQSSTVTATWNGVRGRWEVWS